MFPEDSRSQWSTWGQSTSASSTFDRHSSPKQLSAVEQSEIRLQVNDEDYSNVSANSDEEEEFDRDEDVDEVDDFDEEDVDDFERDDDLDEDEHFGRRETSSSQSSDYGNGEYASHAPDYYERGHETHGQRISLAKERHILCKFILFLF